jgi:hypothetical protein
MLILQASSSDSAAFFLIFQLGLRVVGAIVCYNKAKQLNREPGGWGFFGFLIPIVAMIWVHCIKPKGVSTTTTGGTGSNNTGGTTGSGYQGGYDGGHNNSGSGGYSGNTSTQINDDYKDGDLYK